jgi:hypothetical protein
MQSLGYGGRFVSLLPEDYREKWQKRLGRERIEIASLVLLMLCTLALVLASWRQLVLVSRKQTLLNKIQASQVAVEASDSLASKLVSEYETLRPLFASQQNTLDTLNALALLQQSRSNRSLWYVLLADQQSYFNSPRNVGSGAKPAAPTSTNVVAQPSPSLSALAGLTPLGTNTSPAKPGLIAELSVPEDPEAARIILSQLVRDLKQQKLFSKVDLLSDDLRRSLADPKVIVVDKDFTLALDFAVTDFQPAARSRKAGSPAPRPVLKRVGRATQPGPESAESLSPVP